MHCWGVRLVQRLLKGSTIKSMQRKSHDAAVCKGRWPPGLTHHQLRCPIPMQVLGQRNHQHCIVSETIRAAAVREPAPARWRRIKAEQDRCRRPSACGAEFHRALFCCVRCCCSRADRKPVHCRSRRGWCWFGRSTVSEHTEHTHARGTARARGKTTRTCVDRGRVCVWIRA